MNEDENEDEQIEREFAEANREKPFTANADLEIINNCIMVIQETLNLDNDLYDELGEDKIKAIRQTFEVIMTINKKIIKDYKK